GRGRAPASGLRSGRGRAWARRVGVASSLAARVLRRRASRRPARAARAAGRVDRSAARMTHELPLERRTLHGHFARDLPAILTIDPGDSIAFACPNAGWRLGADEVFEPRDEELDAGHALVGPVDARGAVAGKTLVGRIDGVGPGTF